MISLFTTSAKANSFRVTASISAISIWQLCSTPAIIWTTVSKLCLYGPLATLSFPTHRS